MSATNCSVSVVYTNPTDSHEHYRGLMIHSGKVVCSYHKEQGKFGKYATFEEFDGATIRKETIPELQRAVEERVLRGRIPKELSSWAKPDRIYLTFAGQKYYRNGKKRY